MSFWDDLGDKFAGRDTVSQSTAELQSATAQYLQSAAAGSSSVTPSKNSGNTILVLSVVGTVLIAGAVAFFALKKK